MAASGASFNTTADNEKQLFWVKKPSSNSSREIRDTILRDYFGYTDADIAEVVKKNDQLFYVVNDNEKFWAAIDKVRGWKTNAAGEIAVPIPQKVIENIIAFREARASFEAFKVGMMISNAETRKNVTDDLTAILNSSVKAASRRSII